MTELEKIQKQIDDLPLNDCQELKKLVKQKKLLLAKIKK
jgi:hypothetical protein